jgi:predicted secreted protein
MATFTGENGKVELTAEDSAGTVTVAEVRSWTVEHTKDVIEDTVMGDAARTYKSGLHQFTGSMEVVYDSTHTSATNAFDPAQDGALTVEFYPDATTGQKFSGSVIVTSVSRTASFDDLVTATVNFQGSGALSIAAV